VKTLPIAKSFLCRETIGTFLKSYKHKKNSKWKFSSLVPASNRQVWSNGSKQYLRIKTLFGTTENGLQQK